MNAATGCNAYLNNHYDGMDPQQLILMLYDGALKHLHHARIGVMEADPRKRGEHLSKVIAIVSELNASISPEFQDESTQFLRGLYNSILFELPKVSVTNDISILDQTTRYIQRLKNIWEQDVMGRSGSNAAASQAKPAQVNPPQAPASGYHPTGPTPLQRPAYGGGNRMQPSFNDAPAVPVRKTSILV